MRPCSCHGLCSEGETEAANTSSWAPSLVWPLAEHGGPERRTLQFKGSPSSPHPSRAPSGHGGRSQGRRPLGSWLGHWATLAPKPGPLPMGCFLWGSPARQADPGVGHTLVAQTGKGVWGAQACAPCQWRGCRLSCCFPACLPSRGGWAHVTAASCLLPRPALRPPEVDPPTSRKA